MYTSKIELSIVIPAYNVGKYLQKCLDSILGQTYQDWELILVDDGSVDETNYIAWACAKNDPRVRIVTISNSGPGHARNVGLGMVRGKYVTFVDADDEYATLTTLEENMQILMSDPEIEFLQFPFVHQFTDCTSNGCNFIRPFCVNSPGKLLAMMGQAQIEGYLWNKIFKADILRGVSFPENIILTEDMWFLIDVLQRCQKAYISDKGCYVYYHREGSLVNARSREKEMQVMETYAKLNRVMASLEDVSLQSRVIMFFRSISHIIFSNVYWECELERWLNEYKRYVPSMSCQFISLKAEIKLKIFLINLIGLEPFVRAKIAMKKRKLERRNKRNSKSA